MAKDETPQKEVIRHRSPTDGMSHAEAFKYHDAMEKKKAKKEADKKAKQEKSEKKAAEKKKKQEKQMESVILGLGELHMFMTPKQATQFVSELKL
jgi:hypothetical protein